MRLIAERFANITDDSVVGCRTPYARVGGNNQFRMLEEQGFLYDATMKAPMSDKPLWPYTLHHAIPHNCLGINQNCPTQSFNVWEIVMNELDRREDPSNGEAIAGCTIVDSCALNTGNCSLKISLPRYNLIFF